MRVNKVTAILGKRGSGKTYYILQVIPELKAAHPSRGILIIDTFDSPDYSIYPALTIDQFKRWKGSGIYRLYGANIDEILSEIQERAKNLIIIFEDSTKYIRKNLQENVRRFIIDSKQKNLDLIFTFHGFASVPPEMFRLIDKIVIFKTDNPKYRKNIIIAFDEVKSKYDEVMKSKNPHAYTVANIY